MTIEELIIELLQYPKNTPVAVRDSGGYWANEIYVDLHESELHTEVQIDGFEV